MIATVRDHSSITSSWVEGGGVWQKLTVVDVEGGGSKPHDDVING